MRDQKGRENCLTLLKKEKKRGNTVRKAKKMGAFLDILQEKTKKKILSYQGSRRKENAFKHYVDV